jgi:hypothetical protein
MKRNYRPQAGSYGRNERLQAGSYGRNWLTSKFCYVFIRNMHARANTMVKAVHRTAGELSVRHLNTGLLVLASLILLLIIGRGAGTG